MSTKENHHEIRLNQTVLVSMALLLGIGVGELIHLAVEKDVQWITENNQKQLIEGLIGVSDVFMRLVKMIIAPLVFATLVAGVGKMDKEQNVGRIGGKAMLWFISASIVSLGIGMLLVNYFQPGQILQMDIPDTQSKHHVVEHVPTLRNFIAHSVPKSIIDAMAQNEIIQIVIFSLYFGVACKNLGEMASPIIRVMESLVHIMLKITTYVMQLAPLAVFCAVATIVAQQGLGVITTYSYFMGEFYLGLSVLWIILCAVGAIVLKPNQVVRLVKIIREPIIVAFGTASSEAAYPKLVQQLERFGCQEKIIGFVLPLGYSFNLDGSMMYMTFAVLFIAQVYGIEMGVDQQIAMMLVLLVTSKGVAGVPKASLVVISATLSAFNIPEAGVLLLLGIDQFLDMGRSATNVLGNSLATAVVNKWELKAENKGKMPN